MIHLLVTLRNGVERVHQDKRKAVAHMNWSWDLSRRVNWLRNYITRWVRAAGASSNISARESLRSRLSPWVVDKQRVFRNIGWRWRRHFTFQFRQLLLKLREDAQDIRACQVPTHFVSEVQVLKFLRQPFAERRVLPLPHYAIPDCSDMTALRIGHYLDRLRREACQVCKNTI